MKYFLNISRFSPENFHTDRPDSRLPETAWRSRYKGLTPFYTNPVEGTGRVCYNKVSFPSEEGGIKMAGQRQSIGNTSSRPHRARPLLPPRPAADSGLDTRPCVQPRVCRCFFIRKR